jgi:hypothetical protein
MADGGWIPSQASSSRRYKSIPTGRCSRPTKYGPNGPERANRPNRGPNGPEYEPYRSTTRIREQASVKCQCALQPLSMFSRHKLTTLDIQRETKDASLLGDVHRFCESFFHIQECHEWGNPTCCLGQCTMPRQVTLVVRLQKDGQDVFTARYNNCFRGSTTSNIHAEEFMLQDSELQSLIFGDQRQTKLIIYLTYQPCHHSAGSRGYFKGHPKSCTKLMCQYFTEQLRPHGVQLEIRCTGIYRAHWEDSTLFDSMEDAQLYGGRTAAARAGIALLQAQGVSMTGMQREDWDFMLSLADPDVKAALNPTRMEARHLYDMRINDFLARMASEAAPLRVASEAAPFRLMSEAGPVQSRTS